MRHDAALRYMGKLQRYERLNSVSDGYVWREIMEYETSMRQSWREKSIGGPSLNMTDIVALVLKGEMYAEESRYDPRQKRPWGPRVTFS